MYILVPFGLMLAYAILGGVEFGLPLAGFLHNNEARRAGLHVFSPLWECTNLLLAAAIIAAVLVFPALFPLMVTLLQPLWLVIVGLMIARGLLVLAHYLLQSHDFAVVRWGLAIVSLALPVALIQNVTVLATSDSDLLNHLAIAIALGLLAMVLAIALWSGFYYQPGRTMREVARTSFWLGALLATATLPIALSLDSSLLADSGGVLGKCWPLFAGALVAVACLMIPVRRRYFIASSVLTAGVASALLWLLLPYLVQVVPQLDPLLNLF